MPAAIFSSLPATLEKQLVEEFSDIVRNYREHRWRASELSGGRFCEVAYTIVAGSVSGGTFPSVANKPANFRASCRALESNASLGKGVRFLVLPLLTVLYEVRNNRDVGHVGGDVDSNSIDAFAVVTQASWVMAELIRHLTSRSIHDAQDIVDRLSEYPSPLIWTDGSYRRVLKTGLSLQHEILALLASVEGRQATVSELSEWAGQPNKTYIRKVLSKLDDDRLIRFKDDSGRLSPLGQLAADQIATAAKVA
ncbi:MULTISPECIES: hypothetical protein [unclassified Mesorhizobium]|uniref:hypothetical protein n=1 Tax=unclassified Mesorhizobium TaxID=325217 RepID=UPI00333A040A